MKNDRHYTPGTVAERLVKAARCRSVQRVADFAAGEGDLLRAGSRRWPSAVFVGIDTDHSALQRLKRAGPKWKAAHANFLNGRIVRDRLITMKISSVDVALLNPPFSARKTKAVILRLGDGTSMKCGRAIAFVVESLKYCRNAGEILAILPSGSRYSVRDAEAWRYLEAVCDVHPLFSLGHDTFPECSASAEAYRFVVRRKAPLAKPASIASVGSPFVPDVMIVRGRQPVHRTKPSGKFHVIHTTDLSRHDFFPTRFVDSGDSLPDKPCVLLPRVGKPDPKKICLARLDNHCLSDCVIALVGRTEAVTNAIRSELLKHWRRFAALYHGTGARYTGVLNIGSFLAQRGYYWDCVSTQISRAAIAAAQPNRLEPDSIVVPFAS